MDADRSGSLTTQARRIDIARISHHISPETTCLVTVSVTVSITTNSTAGMDGLHDGPTRPDRIVRLSLLETKGHRMAVALPKKDLLLCLVTLTQVFMI